MVSIIIPVYNLENYIEKCIKTCLDQTVFDLEIIAVNDGSTDLSGSILDRYGLIDSRLKVFHQRNKGVVAARNKGISEAKGEWLMFVDGDDYITKYAVEDLLLSVLRERADIGVGGFYIERGKKKMEQLNKLPFGFRAANIACALLTEQLQFSLCGKIFKRNLFDDIEIPLDLKIGEDAYSVICLFEKTTKIVITSSIVYYYVQRKNSVMNKPSKLAIQSRIQFVKIVTEFYRDKEYFKEYEFQNCYGRWLMNEYFSFLRMGGRVNDFDKKLEQLINNLYLNNTVSVSLLPSWRVFFLKTYRLSPILGNFFRFVFNKLRMLIRKIEN